jgi:hypothetical protein
MSLVPDRVRRRPARGWRRCRRGGIASYPLEQIYQEVAYIAYHFHWSLDDILAMEHDERHIWLREIARINREINEARKRG